MTMGSSMWRKCLAEREEAARSHKLIREEISARSYGRWPSRLRTWTDPELYHGLLWKNRRRGQFRPFFNLAGPWPLHNHDCGRNPSAEEML